MRYRYDERRRLRVKTVELIEEELPWTPILPPSRDPDEMVSVRIGYSETELRKLAKQAGAVWQPESKTWRLSLIAAHALGLEEQIVV